MKPHWGGRGTWRADPEPCHASCQPQAPAPRPRVWAPVYLNVLCLAREEAPRVLLMSPSYKRMQGPGMHESTKLPPAPRSPLLLPTPQCFQLAHAHAQHTHRCTPCPNAIHTAARPRHVLLQPTTDPSMPRPALPAGTPWHGHRGAAPCRRGGRHVPAQTGALGGDYAPAGRSQVHRGPDIPMGRAPCSPHLPSTRSLCSRTQQPPCCPRRAATLLIPETPRQATRRECWGLREESQAGNLHVHT